MATATATLAIEGKDKSKAAFRSAEGSVSGLKKSLKGMADVMAGVAAAVASLAAFKGAAKWIDETQNATDRLGKSAINLGVGVKTLQQFQHVAAQTGINMGALEKAMAGLARAAYDATISDTGATALAFVELGVSVRTASGELKPLEQLFMDTVKGLEKLEGSTRSVALQQVVFGRSGKQTGVMVKEGASGIGFLRKEKVKLGQETEKQTKVAAEYVDQMSRLDQATDHYSRSLSSSITEAILPWLSKLEKGLRISEEEIAAMDLKSASLLELEALQERMITLEGEHTAKIAEKTKIGMQQRGWLMLEEKIRIKALESDLEGMAITSAALEKEILLRNEKITVAKKAEALMVEETKVEIERNKVLEESIISVKEQALHASILEAQFKKNSAAFDEFQENAMSMETPPYIEDTIKDLEKLEAKESELLETQKASLQMFQMAHLDVMDERFAANEETKYNLMESDEEETARIIAMFEERKKIHQTHALDSENMQRINAANIVHIEEAKAKALADIEQQRMLATMETMTSMASAVASEGQAFFEFSKALNIGQAIMNTYTAATKAFAQGGIFGIVTGSIMIALGLAQVAKIKATTFSPPKREFGGPVSTGRPYLVGERGPELFTPQTAGEIQPNSSGVTTVNISVNAIDTEGFDELLFARRAVIVSVINQAMHRQGKRGLV